jgi:putative addiction module component (TIGR02574 family)
VDRERLMEDLLASFVVGAREAVDKAWADEIESRRRAYREGRIGTVTLEESRRRMGL